MLDYNYFRNYKIITIDIGKQQELNAYAKPKQQKKKFNGSLDRGGQTTMFFIIEEVKETILDF